MVGIGGVARWTAEELRVTRPEVLAAARWHLYAERIWPGAEVEAELFAPEKPSEAYFKVERRKGRTAIHAIRKALLPPDEAD